MNALTPFRPLNERQAEFVRLFVSGGNAQQSALAAGYAEGTARVASTQLLESPAVALAIVQAARLRLARGVPLALGTLEHLVEKAVSEKVRLEASKALLDRAGVVSMLPEKEQNTIEKPLHELSLDELRTLVARWEAEIANRAKPINATVSDPSADLTD